MGAAKKGARKRRTVHIEPGRNRNIRVVETQQVQAGQRSFGSASFHPVDIVLPKGYGKIVKTRRVNVEHAAHSGKVKSTSRQYLGTVAGTTHLLFGKCRRPCIRPVCCGEATSLFNPSRQHARRRSARRTSTPLRQRDSD